MDCTPEHTVQYIDMTQIKRLPLHSEVNCEDDFFILRRCVSRQLDKPLFPQLTV